VCHRKVVVGGEIVKRGKSRQRTVDSVQLTIESRASRARLTKSYRIESNRIEGSVSS
jgi:hypothetical protein